MMAQNANPSARNKGPLVLILIGPPASGKSTQTQMLQQRFGFAVISDDQLRAESSTEAGMIAALEARFSKTDLSKGLILDGYPETRAQADALARLLRAKQLPSPLVVQIDVQDQVARDRAKKQGLDMKRFEALLAEFKQEMATAQSSYPEADIWRINGEKTPQDVQQTIRSLMQERQQ
jgi:adenylate kinase family enzyme